MPGTPCFRLVRHGHTLTCQETHILPIGGIVFHNLKLSYV